MRYTYLILFFLPLLLNSQSIDTVKIHQLQDSMDFYFQSYDYEKVWYFGAQILMLCENEAPYENTIISGVFIKIAKLNINRSNPDSAIIYANQALILLDATNQDHHLGIANANYIIGAGYIVKADMEKAMAFLRKALELRINKLGENHPEVAKSYGMIGGVFRHKGDNIKAMEYFERALKIQKKTLPKNHPDIALAYNALGTLASHKRNLDKARTYFEKALAINISAYGENHPELITVYQNIGVIAKKQKRYHEAIKYYKKALQIQLNISEENHVNKAMLYGNLGSLYMNQGRIKEAVGNYKEAERIYSSLFGKYNPGLIDTYIDLGQTYLNMRAYDQAKRYIKMAAESSRYDLNEPQLFESVNYLQRLNNLLDVKKQYYQYQYEDTGDEIFSDSLLIEYKNHIALLDFIYEKKKFQSSREIQAFSTIRLYEKTIRHILKRGNPDENLITFELSEKGKNRFLMEHFLVAKAKEFAAIPEALSSKEQDLKSKLITYNKQLYKEQYENETPNDSVINIYETEIFSLKQQEETFHEQLRKEYPKYHLFMYDHEAVSVAEVQANLKPRESLLEYFVGDSSIFIFVITHENFEIKEIKKDFPLNEWVKDFRESIYTYWITSEPSDSLYDAMSRTYSDKASQLYKKLMAPVESHLKEVIIIVPDDVLNLLPFETLLQNPVDDENVSYVEYPYVIKKHQISYSYSATLLKKLEQHKQSYEKGLLAVAPDFEDYEEDVVELEQVRSGLVPLHYNVEEVHMIHSLFDGVVLVGKEATKEQFLNMAKDYYILHLATHGKANDRLGDFSFLAFSQERETEIRDDRLYVSELYGMDIQADMVVLSACETGLGEMRKGRGIVNIAHGFFYAGAKSTMASLWNVNDEQTTKLMKRFYVNIKLGMPKDAALRNAKLDYIEHEDPAHPYFWAPFVALGNMDPIELYSNSSQQWVIGAGSLLLISLLIFIVIRRKRLPNP